jgi:hypothetical protein
MSSHKVTIQLPERLKGLPVAYWGQGSIASSSESQHFALEGENSFVRYRGPQGGL